MTDQARRHRRPKAHERRALALLAGCGAAGATEAVMLAHGFTVEQLSELVGVGFAVPTSECVDGAKFRITEAGQRAMPRPRGGAR
jgi:hypothetical protein